MTARQAWRNVVRAVRLIDRRAWRFYRGGGLVIGLVWLQGGVVIPAEMVLRRSARQRVIRRRERRLSLRMGSADA